jgi:hypothetical protein
MATEITALFDTADTADFALRQLRDKRIVCESFNIKPIWRTGAADRANQPPTAFPSGAFNSVGEMEATANSGAFAVQGYGSLLLDSWRRDARDTQSDNQNREVILSVLVAEQDAAHARSVLISEHGRQVR